jgi:cyanophycinase
LVIIGGREDRGEGDMRILGYLADLAGTGRLVVASAATAEPKEVFRDYRKVFRCLGVPHVDHLHVEDFADARSETHRKMIDRAQAVFFTGGDQLKITSKIGGSPLVDALFDLYARGGTIAGTSAPERPDLFQEALS